MDSEKHLSDFEEAVNTDVEKIKDVILHSIKFFGFTEFELEIMCKQAITRAIKEEKENAIS